MKSLFVAIRRAALLGLAAAPLALMAPAASAENLGEALAMAYRTSPPLRAERARLRATDEQVAQAKAGWRPTVTAELSTNHRWSIDQRIQGNGATADPFDQKITYRTTEDNPATASIQLAQPVFRGFRTVENIKAAEANVRTGRQELLVAEQDLFFRAIQAYMNVIRDRQILNIRQQNIALLQKQANAAKQRFDVGEVTQTDVAQSRARVSQASADAARARSQLASSIANYERVVGKKPGSLKYPKPARTPGSLEEAHRLAQKINPSILAAAYRIDSAAHRVKVIRGELLPEAQLTATARTTDDWSRKGGLDSVFNVGAAVSIPIYEGGQVYSNVREAKQDASRFKILRIEATRQVREAVNSSWNQFKEAKAQIQAAKAQVAAAQLAYDGVEQEYLVGSRTTIDVLNAQQELLNARVNLIAFQRDEIVTSYQLLGAMGRLTAEHLQLRTPIYDPTANYNKVKDKWIGTKADTIE